MTEVTMEDLFEMVMKWKAYAEEGDRTIEALRAEVEILTHRLASERAMARRSFGQS